MSKRCMTCGMHKKQIGPGPKTIRLARALLHKFEGVLMSEGPTPPLDNEEGSTASMADLQPTTIEEEPASSF